jgi:hypothetical protein
MQKVVGSNPFSRSEKRLQIAAFRLQQPDSASVSSDTEWTPGSHIDGTAQEVGPICRHILATRT